MSFTLCCYQQLHFRSTKVQRVEHTRGLNYRFTHPSMTHLDSLANKTTAFTLLYEAGQRKPRTTFQPHHSHSFPYSTNAHPPHHHLPHHLLNTSIPQHPSSSFDKGKQHEKVKKKKDGKDSVIFEPFFQRHAADITMHSARWQRIQTSTLGPLLHIWQRAF
jgi:hypothetical protein